MLQGRRSHACLLPSRVALAQDPHLPGAENPGTHYPKPPQVPPALLTVSGLARLSPSLNQFLHASATLIRFFKKAIFTVSF